MQFAVLVEQMRREGFEVLVSRPMVITKRINDVTCEPYEILYLDVPDNYLGPVMKCISERKGRIEDMNTSNAGSNARVFCALKGLHFVLGITRTTNALALLR
ncbi:MAG: hypothetical protein B9S34_15430 [Opitutia bacterium Tous-C1TDCM]|jgi:GTP-binding protein|nr:MAG: hypothetical protein B9S34_15430 [Opitutae bacterium Tous-C1TDCM]